MFTPNCPGCEKLVSLLVRGHRPGLSGIELTETTVISMDEIPEAILKEWEATHVPTCPRYVEEVA